MSNLEDTLNQLLTDLKPLQISREMYLSLLVEERLEDQTTKYNDDFDKLVKQIQEDSIRDADIISMSRKLRFLSDSFLRQYDNLIKDLEKFQNYLNKFT